MMLPCLQPARNCHSPPDAPDKAGNAALLAHLLDEMAKVLPTERIESHNKIEFRMLAPEALFPLGPVKAVNYLGESQFPNLSLYDVELPMGSAFAACANARTAFWTGSDVFSEHLGCRGNSKSPLKKRLLPALTLGNGGGAKPSVRYARADCHAVHEPNLNDLRPVFGR
jgi:hypothetical protein